MLVVIGGRAREKRLGARDGRGVKGEGLERLMIVDEE
jgi:hypothetical protein